LEVERVEIFPALSSHSPEIYKLVSFALKIGSQADWGISLIQPNSENERKCLVQTNFCK
jgi:hypothetical protein